MLILMIWICCLETILRLDEESCSGQYLLSELMDIFIVCCFWSAVFHRWKFPQLEIYLVRVGNPVCLTSVTSSFDIKTSVKLGTVIVYLKQCLIIFLSLLKILFVGVVLWLEMMMEVTFFEDLWLLGFKILQAAAISLSWTGIRLSKLLNIPLGTKLL